jgi:DNA-binding MarR family transcriptional regulator
MATLTALKPRDCAHADHRRTSYLIKRLENGVRVLLDRAIHDYGITSGQYLLLSLVSREGGLSSAELARRTSVTPQSMNESIAALEQKKLVRRTEDRSNRRVLLIALTREGRRVLTGCNQAVDDAEEQYFRALKPAKLAELRALIEVLLDTTNS